MILSIIIPVYNEEKTIPELLRRVFAASSPGWEKQVIVVNDGSTDGTKEILQHLQTQYSFKLITHEKNLGKGTAVRAGLTQTTGDDVLIQDADLEYNPADYTVLLSALTPEVGAVFGSRMHQGTKQGYLHYILGAKILNKAINILYGSNITDAYTCYKLIRTPILQKLDLESKGFEIEAEIICKLLINKVGIVEIPISYHPRSFAQGKKIRSKDGLIGLKTALKYFFHR